MIDRSKKCCQLPFFLPLLTLASVAFALAPNSAFAQSTATQTQTLEATIVPLGRLVTLSSSLVLKKSTSTPNSYSGILTIQYAARTSQGAGQGTITVEATKDFTPTSGPSIAKPPSPADGFIYTCGGATLGVSCNGVQAVSLTAATNVVSIGASSCTGGGGSCSTAEPNILHVTFNLADDPKYETGSYSATLTWTISAS